MDTIRVRVYTKSTHPFRFKIRTIKLAYKNLWFQRKKSSIVSYVFLVHFLMYLALETLYSRVHTMFSCTLGTVTVLMFFWFVLPALFLRLKYKEDPEYVERLASTLPDYYNKITFSLPNTNQ